MRKGAEGVHKERRRKGGRERETHARKRTSYQTFAKIPLLKEEHFQVRITELFGPFFRSILLPPNVLCDKASHKEEQTPWKMVTCHCGSPNYPKNLLKKALATMS